MRVIRKARGRDLALATSSISAPFRKHARYDPGAIWCHSQCTLSLELECSYSRAPAMLAATFFASICWVHQKNPDCDDESLPDRSLHTSTRLSRCVDRQNQSVRSATMTNAFMTKFALGSGHSTALKFNRKGDLLASGRVNIPTYCP